MTPKLVPVFTLPFTVSVLLFPSHLLCLRQHFVINLHCFYSPTILPLFVSHATLGIQQNLHIVLIMDCSNSNFTINCESNPAFYRKCSVQWMEGWSESSMKKVSGRGGGQERVQQQDQKQILNQQLLITFTPILISKSG